MTCEIDGCLGEVNRDGLCFKHKIRGVRLGGLARMRSERAANTTQTEIRNEILDSARRSGREIERAR